MLLPDSEAASRGGAPAQMPAMIAFKKARIEDAETLTEVQRRTFDDDSRRFLGLPDGGPEGYDSVEWQLDAMREGIYYKVVDGERIVGGVVLWDRGNGHMHLGVLFIEPEVQDRVLGRRQ